MSTRIRRRSRVGRQMHTDLVKRIAEADGDIEEAFCEDCAAPLLTLMYGGLCDECIEKGEDDD